MKKCLILKLVFIMTLSQSLAVLPAQNNPFGLVYENALKENIEGRVNIHPVTYRLHDIEIAANVYVPAGYDPANKYAAIVVAHPNGGVKEQVAGLYAQRLAEKGYITLVIRERAEVSRVMWTNRPIVLKTFTAWSII